MSYTVILFIVCFAFISLYCNWHGAAESTMMYKCGQQRICATNENRYIILGIVCRFNDSWCIQWFPEVLRCRILIEPYFPAALYSRTPTFLWFLWTRTLATLLHHRHCHHHPHYHQKHYHPKFLFFFCFFSHLLFLFFARLVRHDSTYGRSEEYIYSIQRSWICTFWTVRTVLCGRQ